jgi:uncharacterized membrane protein
MSTRTKIKKEGYMKEAMPKNRLEAFSDGVIAIIITIMVLEIQVPHSPRLIDLQPVVPVFLSYILSFLYVGIYWGNHHHLIHAARYTNSAIMWANMHLLFWLSLIPFATAWFGENHGQTWPTALYGAILLLTAISYFILQGTIVRAHPDHTGLAQAFGVDWKGRISVTGYVAGVVFAFLVPWLSVAIYVALAVLWFIPDRRAAKASLLE